MRDSYEYVSSPLPSPTNFPGLSLAELRAHCTNFGLVKSGGRAALQDRLQYHVELHERATTAPPAAPPTSPSAIAVDAAQKAIATLVSDVDNAWQTKWDTGIAAGNVERDQNASQLKREKDENQRLRGNLTAMAAGLTLSRTSHKREKDENQRLRGKLADMVALHARLEAESAEKTDRMEKVKVLMEKARLEAESAEKTDRMEEELVEVMSYKDTEGPWMFEIPEEHAIPAPEGTEDWDGTDSVVIELKDGTFAVVGRDWYDEADDGVGDDDYKENMVGTLTDTTYPDEGEEITGTYTPKA